MVLKFPKIQKRELLGFVAALLTILASGTVFFDIIYGSTLNYIYWGFAILLPLLLGVEINRTKKALPSVCIFSFFFLLSLGIHFTEYSSSQLHSVLGYLLTLLATFSIVCSVDKHVFVKWYLRILLFYSLVSLVCFSIAVLSEPTARSLCQPGYNWRDHYGYSMLYTWGINGTIYKRNPGPFWEPGAFQEFLVMGILFELYNTGCESSRLRRITLAVFLITLITTQSTTGYLCLLILIVFYHETILSVLGISDKYSRLFLSFLLIFLGSFVILSSGTVVNKLIHNENSVSAQMRYGDLKGGLIMSLQGGPFGLGETDLRTALRDSMGLSRYDSNGLMSMTYTFGWFLSGFYIFRLFTMPERVFKEHRLFKGIAIIVIFFFFHMTEKVWHFPFFWLLILM